MYLANQHLFMEQSLQTLIKGQRNKMKLGQFFEAFR